MNRRLVRGARLCRSHPSVLGDGLAVEIRRLLDWQISWGGSQIRPILDPHRLARRVASEGLRGSITIVRGDPHDPRLLAASVDLALLVHIYHEVAQPYGLLWNLRPALRPGGRVAVIDARKVTAQHATPPDLLRCELAAVGYRQTASYDLQ